jgi:hypothetical protein
MKKLYIILAFVTLATAAHAQFWEAGGLIGFSSYQGEFNQSPIVFARSNPAIGAFVRMNFNRHIAIKGNVYLGSISGADSNANDDVTRNRNLHFRSRIIDVGAQVEFNFLSGYEVLRSRNKTAFYSFIGLNVVRFDPEAQDNSGEWVRLQPLNTEGQGTVAYNDIRQYSLAQLVIPLGLGIKHNIRDRWTLGFEVGPRITFTDYLDDVSGYYPDNDYLSAQRGPLSAEMSNRTADKTLGSLNPRNDVLRGDPNNNDWYVFTGLTLSYTFHPGTCFRW